MGVFNTVCHDNIVRRREEQQQVTSAGGMPGRRTRKKPGDAIELHELTFSAINETDRNTIVTEVKDKLYAGRTLYTPPGEGSDRPFAIVEGSFRENWISGVAVTIQLVLEALREVSTA